MKKHGFTLAEVLITLAIIGVVASLTLPALMANVQEQQTVTALKKATNTLVEAATMNAANEGFDFNDVDGFGDPDNIKDDQGRANRTVWGILGTNANIDMARSSSSEIVFKDGTSILSRTDANCGTRRDSGISHSIGLTFDATGPKNPNANSECTASSGVTSCADKRTRSVKDRINICVGGTSVWGADGVANWALTGAGTSNQTSGDMVLNNKTTNNNNGGGSGS